MRNLNGWEALVMVALFAMITIVMVTLITEILG